MAWFRIDDGWHSHPKVMLAGNAAAGLWARCGSYCSQHNLEGRIPVGIAEAYGARKEIADLVRVGLWVRDGDVYVMPDWLDYNPSAESVKAKRKADAERQRKAREAAASRRDTERDSQRDETMSHAPPDPTRPDPTIVTGCTETTDDPRSVEPSSVVVDFTDAIYTTARLMANELASTARNVQDRNAWIAATTKGVIRERSEDITRLLREGMTVQQAAEFLTGTSRRDHLRVIDSPQVDELPLHGPWLPPAPAVSQDEHIEQVRARAAAGDEEAKEELAVWEKRLARKAALGGSR